MGTGDERKTGSDALIQVPNGNTVPVSNVTWDREVEQTEVQHTQANNGPSGALKPTIAVTGLRYSGSFEYDGSNKDLKDQLWKGDGRPERVTMTIVEFAGREDGDGGTTSAETMTVTLENVIVTGQSRDIPSDDVTSSSWDFVAEDMTVS